MLGYNHTGTAKKVTQLPDVLPQSRALISGRSKGTGHGDLRIYTDKGKGHGRKGRGQEKDSSLYPPQIFNPKLSVGL